MGYCLKNTTNLWSKKGIHMTQILKCPKILNKPNTMWVKYLCKSLWSTQAVMIWNISSLDLSSDVFTSKARARFYFFFYSNLYDTLVLVGIMLSGIACWIFNYVQNDLSFFYPNLGVIAWSCTLSWRLYFSDNLKDIFLCKYMWF